jgi:hypothetical protein
MARGRSEAERQRLVIAILAERNRGMAPETSATRHGVALHIARCIHRNEEWPGSYSKANRASMEVVTNLKDEHPLYREMKDDPAYVEVRPRRFMKRADVVKYDFLRERYLEKVQ